MEEPNEEKFISMCMECEQTFYDEHIYKVHACYPIDSMVEPSLGTIHILRKHKI